MKKVYFGKKEEALKKLKNLINVEISRVEEIGNFGPNPDSFLEKYDDPYFDFYREEDEDHDVPNEELLQSFEVAYNYLHYLRKCVAIEEEWEQEIKEEEEEREREWEKERV